MKIQAAMIVFLLVGGLSSYWFFRTQAPPSFSELSSDEQLQRVIEERDFAIEKAIREGIYECCVEPPCTMCYLEANQWNNFQAGTCGCDKLIAEGKEPCPQCKKGLCETAEEGTCAAKGI